MTITFSNELREEVKNNWLTRDNFSEFKNCKTNSDWCRKFTEVSLSTEMETGLMRDIVNVICSQLIKIKKN